jgi:hypothetical protein
MAIMPFIAIDFEASCLPQYGRSFPIEVGIASPLGWSRSWLIRPHAAWMGWQWRQDAQAVHGITLEQLHREGLEAEQVASQLRSAIGDSDVVADSRLDDDWSRTLFEAAGEGSHIPVASISDWPAFQAIGAARMEAAIAAADAAGRRRHRAESDALWLARLMTELGLDRSAELASINARSSTDHRQFAIAR